MEIELLNKISSASINGYYDPSIGLVVVWFHNTDDDKPDLVAYLQSNMEWDLREVDSEKSKLFDDKEVIEISHKNIDKFKKDSKFDKVVRKILNQVIEHSLKENTQSPELETMKTVLDNDSYNQKEEVK